MIAKLILDKKREGRALGTAEIREFIDGFTRGEIPDYQMSALAMAICCRGMTGRETADMTDAMMRSGRCLEWDFPTADKHSTGGVGDKLSLVVQPLAAACGVRVPSLTGRGLGITGGTADKLETIPGYNASLSLDDFQRVVRDVGVSMTVQTEEITPADRKLYALRDVTGTVASIPLIVSSILSKKLAEGASVLVFDVKCGSGAFMKTREDAQALARALVDGAKSAGRRAAALVTDMSAPLGRAVGNANEVAEALSILRGEVAPERADVALSVELAALMVSLVREAPLDEVRAECLARLADGSALARFEAMAAAQGGDLAAFARFMERPTFKFRIQAMRSGYVSAIDAEKVARVAFALGAGRMAAGDRIDPLAGVTLSVGVGDRVATGAPLATLERSESPDGLESAAADLLKAFTISHDAPELGPLILERMD
ncbi:MAG: thymidine phosphorylase [Kiritimatiellae bacterium]|nr:thymidine phosphorylase [Kiritimatiellia bacterium]